jgi:O-antigen/teichoic acid export membrane protein
MSGLKSHLYRILRWSEKYTKTDMVYLAHGGFWINLGSVSVSLFSFFLYLAFARFLPQDIYGTYQYLLSLGTIVGAFTLTGMNSAITRAVARGYEGTVNASIPFQLRWGLLPLLGSCALGAYYFLHGNHTLGFGLILIGIFVPLNNALNSYGAWITGRKDFRSAFIFNLFTNLLFYPALILAAFFSKEALILLIANLLSQAVALAVGYRLAEKKYRPNTDVDPDAFSFGGHLSIMGAFGTVVSQIDNVLTFHLLGANALAIYSFATALPDRIASLVKFIPSIALPKLATRDKAELRSSLWPKVLWALSASTIIALLYMLIARAFYTLFFPAYIASVPYSMLYALIIIPMIGGVFTSALTAHRSIRALYILNSIIPTLQLVCMIIGVLLFGLWGLIIAKIATTSLQFILGALLFFFYDETRAE